MVQKIGSIFKDIQAFKKYLSNYNNSLNQELVQRRDLGCYLQLLGKERKKSHKYYIDRVKTIERKQDKANGTAGKSAERPFLAQKTKIFSRFSRTLFSMPTRKRSA